MGTDRSSAPFSSGVVTSTTTAPKSMGIVSFGSARSASSNPFAGRRGCRRSRSRRSSWQRRRRRAGVITMPRSLTPPEGGCCCVPLISHRLSPLRSNCSRRVVKVPGDDTARPLLWATLLLPHMLPPRIRAMTRVGARSRGAFQEKRARFSAVTRVSHIARWPCELTGAVHFFR